MSTQVPKDRKYLESHEWLKADGPVVTIGITQLAADQLSDVTYVDLPDVGRVITAGEVFGEIESVKATSELYSGVSGKVVEINTALTDQPELVNDAPFEAGWMIKIETADPADLEQCLNAEAYEQKYADA